MLVFEETVAEKKKERTNSELEPYMHNWQIGGRQVISPLASALMVKVSWIFVYFNSSTSDVNPF